MKPWVEVDLIAGQFSNKSTLSFESSAKFTDSETLEIQLKFKETLAISLYSEPERIQVSLWGAFISKTGHYYINDENRVKQKSVPPQILEDWATQSVAYLTEEEVISSASFASVAGNVLKKLFTKGTLNSVISMIAGVQLLVHTALVNIQFPGNAFLLYEELI